MNLQQALNIFNLAGEITENDVKATFKKLALKFHPDRNPVGTEMMKSINAAYDIIIANITNLNTYQQTAAYNYGEQLENVLNALNDMIGVVYEVTGNWIWISGDTKTHKDELKEIGCKWSPKKLMWYYRPEEYRGSRHRKSHTIDEIRAKYGTSGEKKAEGAKRVKA